MRVRFGISALAKCVPVLLIAAPAMAQETKLLEYRFETKTSHGVFAGCQITYKVMGRDWQYASGRPVIISGSVASYYWEGKQINLLFKACGYDVESDKHENMTFSMFRIFQAFPIIRDDASDYQLPDATWQCDDGCYCTTHFGTKAIDTMGVNGIAYSRREGGLDVRFSFASDGESLKTTAPGQRQFIDCMDKIVDLLYR